MTTVSNHMAAELFISTAPYLHLLGGTLTVYATHGFADALPLFARPNPTGIAPPRVFEVRAARWTAKWSHVTIRHNLIKAAR